jgi:hypothetical protein
VFAENSNFPHFFRPFLYHHQQQTSEMPPKKKLSKETTKKATKSKATIAGSIAVVTSECGTPVKASRGRKPKKMSVADVEAEKPTSTLVTPDKGPKIFFSVNKTTHAYIRHESKQAAMDWFENLRTLDPRTDEKYVLQDFPSVAAMTSFIDSLGPASAKPSSSMKPGSNPMAGVGVGRSGASAAGKLFAADCHVLLMSCILYSVIGFHVVLEIR